MEETEVNIAATMGIKGEHVTKGVKDKGKGIGRSKVEIVKKSCMKINLRRNEIERNTRFKGDVDYKSMHSGKKTNE